MRVLVTGAAGYIGSVVTAQLVEAGHEVVALDNLCHGYADAVHPDATFVRADLLDREAVAGALSGVDAVAHLAAEALIDESIRNPARFFQANLVGGLNLLDGMLRHGVWRLVFSSTAAVYGEPESLPITEDAKTEPVNSYGESKLAFERALAWYRRAYGMSYVTFRYFNVCGATDRNGEMHDPETHLIPILLEVASGRRQAINLYGTDYDTPDGTCIRDYVHVSDIARAHVLALEQVDGLGASVLNVGNDTGHSNREVIEATRRVTGREIAVVPSDRRPGDPARLVASDRRTREVLGWTPRYVELEPMIESAWKWMQTREGQS